MAARHGLHEDLTREEEVQGSSNRSFGLVFTGFFAIVAAISAWRHGWMWPWATGIAAAFLIVSFVAAGLLAPLNRAWMKFGLLLGRIVAPVVLGLLFFLSVVPIGLIMRARGKDLLRLKFDRGASSYWIERTPPGPPPETMRKQF
ncbi:MAG: hypothetical protein KF889_06705 [Alphaproteobacteria bacterium]|nr:hypothetical protein [Alphaproteobacteria bacterium]MCW5740509.1 hypothetical protein [Alphaproteobacteria bacterium]